MILPKESATFSSCRFYFFILLLIPNSRYREFIDWRRSKGGYSDDLELAANISDNTPNPEHSTEAAHDISVALSALNETEKSLVLLFYMEDLPIKKISDITGIPQGTVKVYLARSRTKMAKILETDESNR